MTKLQYTIRNIPPMVDQAIRKQTEQTGKSFNQTVVDILSLQTLGTTNPKVDNNFDWLYNKNTLDESFDETIENLSSIDNQLWQ
ncbi:MAG: hypothetical protein AAB971_00215 [Patescibacteria group bacterium]